ncbi:MAG: PAS domain S-box protein [Gallionella sp.]|nr:PAS domain S-box protein [Gallionella sp.]
MSQPDTNPTMEKLRVLNLENDENDSELIRAELETGWKEIELMRVDTREAFVRALGEFKPDVVLSDFQLPGFDGRSALGIVRQTHPEIPVIIVTGALADIEALNLVKMGAKDYVMKDHLQRLTSSVQSALSREQGIRTRKAMVNVLREDEVRYQAIMSNANDAIVCIQSEGLIYLWNRKAEEMFGYTAEEAIGRNLPQLVIPEQYHKSAEEALQYFAQTGSCPLTGMTSQMMARRKDNNEFPIELSVSYMNINGEWHGIGIIRDITERKQAEAGLAANLEHMTRLNEELQRTNMELKTAQRQLLQSEKMASIGLLAAGVAHEINNPVGYINSNLGTLEKYLAGIFTALDKYEEIVSSDAHDSQELQKLQRLNEKLDLDFLRGDIKSLLAESREGLGRIKGIVLNLKDFSRSSADEAWQWADLTKCLESTLTIVWNELKYKCEVVKEFGVLPQIYCLPLQLDQVFMNLLVNAAQSIETRGTITIRTGQERDRVWAEITDTGAGIPADILPRIFDPFFTTKPVGTGTGLGLSVSYGIIERHHGKIEVRSEIGKGSTFRVILPVQPNINKEEA